ncbi:MAG: NAD(P)H-hydrate dehydratase [Caulobacteraceae bacterium]
MKSLGHEIVSVAQMAAADKAACDAGLSTFDLMIRAGVAVADLVTARWSVRPTLVLCGPGNNGGDGFIIAQTLVDAGWPVRVACSVDVARLKGAAAQAAQDWTGETARLSEGSAKGAELIIDALFGAGLARPVTALIRSVLAGCEAAGTPILAVDLPSGLNGDTGKPMGYAPHVALTVSFHRKKPAHVLEPGRSLCGEIVIADIGLSTTPDSKVRLWENLPDLWLDRYPWPSTDTHKTERGRLVVVSGHAWNTGAARLAARAGLRIGAGLVTILSPIDALTSNAAHLEAVMLVPFDSDAELAQAAEKADVAVIGPAAGVSAQTRANLKALARTGAALVVDADVLTAFRDAPGDLFSVLDRDDVLTPHPGEFERIFPDLLKTAPDRITAARKAADRAGAVVLLKGADTVIAAPDGRAVVNTNAAPWLATAGSGDVLAGLVGGLIAQGMDSFDAACAGAWIHAEAGATFGPGLISEDLPGCVPALLGRLLRRADWG